MKTEWQAGLPRWSVVLLLVAGLWLVSCYPGDITDIAELDTVTTLYDKAFPFSQQSTYSMPDSVFHLCEVLDDPPKDCISLSRSNDLLILDTVRAQMAGYGWTLVADDTGEDVKVVVAALGSETTSWYAWYPWNPWYGGGWYYPPVWQPVTYSKGTVAVNMAIPDSMITIPGVGEGVPVVWTGVMNGGLGSSSSSTRSRLQSGIIQAFSQSPYLVVEGSTP